MKQYILFLIFCFNYLHNCECEGVDSLNKGNTEINLILYPDAASILKVLNEPQNIKHSGVPELLNVYSLAQAKQAQIVASGAVKKYPLIVIEGLSGSGKTTISGDLVKKINGTQIHSPLLELKNVKRGFHNDSVILNAYHQLAHYITALHIMPLLTEGPVVLDRYYHSAVTYIIARSVFYNPGSLMPPKGDKMYNWPKDLLKPDIEIFLEVDEEQRIQRLTTRTNKTKPGLGKNEILLHVNYEYKKNVLLAYKNMENIHMTFVNANPPEKEVLEDVYSKVLPLLKKH